MLCCRVTETGCKSCFVVGSLNRAASSVVGSLKQIANLVLLALMFAACYTHYMMGDALNKTTPAIVFGLLLACRFVTIDRMEFRLHNYAFNFWSAAFGLLYDSQS